MRAWLTITCGNSDRPSSTSCTRPVRTIRDRSFVVGPPEHGLVHPVGLGDQALAEPERLEHLHRAAGDAIGLPEFERTRPALDDARRDPRELGQLSGQHQPRRTGARR